MLTKEDLKRIILQEMHGVTRGKPNINLRPLSHQDLYLRFYAVISSAGIPMDEVYAAFDEAIREYRKHTGELLEKFSKKERAKRRKKCGNPKGFTMKQFCKNQRTRSKKGERKNEELELEERCQKGYKTHPTRKTKKMYGKTYRNCVKAKPKKRRRKIKETELAEADPKKGTGKKPKGSGRRLYTDEDPSDTVSVSFKSVSAIQKTLSKKSFKSKSHKRQSQIINLIHQRARAAYRNAKDPKTKARLKRAFNYAKKRKEASKRKTIRLRKKKK